VKRILVFIFEVSKVTINNNPTAIGINILKTTLKAPKMDINTVKNLFIL